jgi:anti-sigma regulatory factor (Ser/Thr protein kinase)
VEVIGGIVAVAERTDVAEVRRRAATIADRLAFDDVTGGRVAIAVTEAATNLLKHAGGGDVYVGLAGAGDRCGIQIVAMDRGPGIRDLATSLADGYSTAGSSGTGLGALRRSSDTFDIYSTRAGTVIAATVYPAAARLDHHPYPIGAVCVPAPGEEESGDAWAAWAAGELTSIFLCDGLGHGTEAARAANLAVQTFRRQAERSAPDVIASVHDALKPTRGGAVALAELDQRHGTLRYAGLGNISAVVVRPDGTEQHLISLAGIAGHVLRRLQVFTYDWPVGSMLIMHSDGLGTHWSLGPYPGLSVRRPDIVAGVLYRDCRRGSDDVAVLAVRNEEAV